MTETEYKLLNWRGASLNAERMCADILIMLDFESVDPQSPLGGPDGKKDILCKKSDWEYLAAVYFPPLPKAFKSIKAKFIGDFEGVESNDVDGIIFMTNQNLTPSHKKTLKSIAENENKKCIIYDNEAIRSLLDSGLGLPIRLLHLKIKLDEADQIAFFCKQQNRFPQYLDSFSKKIIEALSAKINECCENKEEYSNKIDAIHSFAQQTMAFMQETPPKSDKSRLKFPKFQEAVTENLSTEILLNIHKLMLYDSRSSELGKYRSQSVWIGSSDEPIDKASFIPPKPEVVQVQTENLLKSWRLDYHKLKQSNSISKIIERIAQFHCDFLAIHPFLDGNGRVARFLLNQQVSELLDVKEQVIIADNPSYYNALNEGRVGNLKPLEAIISIAVFGTDMLD